MKTYIKELLLPLKRFTKEKPLHALCFFGALAFCLFSLVFFSVKKEESKAFMSLLSILYVFLPSIAQKLCKFRISLTLYAFTVAYTVCPLLGYSYGLYYLLPWWDDILHAFAGVLFAMFGAYLPKVMCKNGDASLSLCVFSAFFFSVAVAGLWELVEYTVDSNFGTDMQKDSLLITPRPSYLISELLDAPKGQFADVREWQLTVNGTPIEGYVDLGLLDTMTDIFVETFGAATYTVAYRIGGGKYFVFEKVDDEPTVTVTPNREAPSLPSFPTANEPTAQPDEEVAVADEKSE